MGGFPPAPAVRVEPHGLWLQRYAVRWRRQHSLAVLFFLYAISDALVKSMPGKTVILGLRRVLEQEQRHPRAQVTMVRSTLTVVVNSSR
jgi:hypothetical protein